MVSLPAARVIDPVEGSVLHHRHGKVVSEGLLVPVLVELPDNSGDDFYWVNGQLVTREGRFIRGECLLRQNEETIQVNRFAEDGPVVATTRVVYDRGSFPRYRFAIDDNIYFLEEIARKLPRSIFECFYLAGLRDLHLRYGTKFVLNVFFSTPDGKFTLDRFPETYRSEFADNADWLSLAFHGKAEFPDRPYQHADPEVLAADYDLVANEILRFAGDAAYSPTTVTHWAMVRTDAWQVLTKRSTRVLSGFFVPGSGGTYTSDGEGLALDDEAAEYDINYCMDAGRSALLNRRDLLKDFASGLLFSKVELVCNNTPPAQVDAILRPLTTDPNTAEVMDLLTHEQYFWPQYPKHVPDHFARCEAAIRFCTENGYRPVFFHQGIAGSSTEP